GRCSRNYCVARSCALAVARSEVEVFCANLSGKRLRKVFRARKLLLAHAFRDSAAGGFCLCGCVFGSRTATPAINLRAPTNSGESFSCERTNATWFTHCRRAASAQSLLVRHFRSRYGGLRLD